jgi:hypothetical protein
LYLLLFEERFALFFEDKRGNKKEEVVFGREVWIKTIAWRSSLDMYHFRDVIQYSLYALLDAKKI